MSSVHFRGKTLVLEIFFCSTASKVMITAGDPWKTEIVDVVNGVNCSDMASLSGPFYYHIYGAVGANLDGSPVVCGGEYTEKCYRFANGVWEEFTSMKQKRQYAAAVMYNKKLHVFGGWDNSFRTQTSETINVDGDVSDGPDLPTGVLRHAMTKISDKVSLLSGGDTYENSNSAQTWYYNHDTEAFTSGPDLLQGRTYHGSAVNVDKVTKAIIAVVTGGLNANYTNYLDSTEMLINGQWKIGTIQCRKKNVLICFSAIFV